MCVSKDDDGDEDNAKVIILLKLSEFIHLTHYIFGNFWQLTRAK